MNEQSQTTAKKEDEQAPSKDVAEALLKHSAQELGRMLLSRNVKDLNRKRIERQIRRLGLWGGTDLDA